MSSYKNAIKGRAHKERAQPHGREKLGLLEKHKDYKQRAKSFHRKEDKIKELREKASYKNPDEFYHEMVSSRTQDGVHKIERKTRYSSETLKRLKLQDLTYLRMRKIQEDKKIERLRAELHGLIDKDPQSDDQDQESSSTAETKSVLGKRKHVIYLEEKEKIETWDAAEHFQTVPELVNRSFNRPRKEDLKVKPILTTNLKKDTLKTIEKNQKKKYEEFLARKARSEELMKMILQLERSRNLTTKGRRTKIVTKDIFGEEDKEKTIYKWKLERKK